MGAGDGDHKVGPGRVVLRFTQSENGSSVRMLAYEMRQRFTVVSKALFWTTTVLTDTQTRPVTSAPTIVAEGSLQDRSVRWSHVVGSFRSDGTLVCDGSMCGKFGAPPAGRSELHMGPSSMPFNPFEFSSDMKTFSMRPILASKTEVPQQESYVALAGRETGRACAAPTP